MVAGVHQQARGGGVRRPAAVQLVPAVEEQRLPEHPPAVAFGEAENPEALLARLGVVAHKRSHCWRVYVLIHHLDQPRGLRD